MFSLHQGPIESHTKVNWVVIVRKRSTVHNYIELSMCIPVIYVETCHRGLSGAIQSSKVINITVIE